MKPMFKLFVPACRDYQLFKPNGKRFFSNGGAYTQENLGKRIKRIKSGDHLCWGFGGSAYPKSKLNTAEAMLQKLKYKNSSNK